MIKKINMKAKKGFTLIELIIVVVVSGLIIAGASMLLSQGFGAYFTGQNVMNAEWQGTVALERMVRDLRAVSFPANITAATSSSITFRDINANTITYNLVNEKIMHNNQVLAEGIQGLTFKYYDANGNDLGATPAVAQIRFINITLDITYAGTDFSLSAGVFPWNLQ